MTQLRHNRMEYPVRRFRTRADWQAYARWLRQHARVSLALDPAPPRSPLKARIFDRFDGDGFTVEKVHFQSLPGFYVTGNLYRPATKPRGKQPAILCPHGHARYGRLHDDNVTVSIIARCVQLARMGATVFNHDMVGYNDACQTAHHGFPEDHPWGLSLMSMQTWNSVRALDFLESFPGVDRKRIGVTGCSGGGTQTFTLGAIDERVAAAAPVCMASYHFQGGCQCENAPLLRIDATSVELTRLMAPKPVFLGSCTGDWTLNSPRVELPAVRAIHKLYGKASNVRGKHVDDVHNYNRPIREAMYGFFNHHLFGAKTPRPVREGDFARPDLSKLMVWHGITKPSPLRDKAMLDLWRDSRRKALRGAKSQHLVKLLPHVLAIGPDGVSDDLKPTGLQLNADGDTIIVSSSRRNHRDRSDEVLYCNSYNPTPTAQRAQEVIAAVQRHGRKVRLVGEREAGLWCVLAAAATNRVKAVEADVKGGRAVDLPSFEQIGGMKTVEAAVADRWHR